MGPPPIDPTPIQPQGGNTTTGGYPAGGNGGGGNGGGGRSFNQFGGMGMPSLGGGPTYAGGGPGWMPPPPIGDPYGGGYRINPYDNRPIGNRGAIPTDRGGGNPTPVYPSRPVGWAPQRMPVVQPQIPGWAGYLQWLQMMGGGRMPPPPIGGI